MQERQRFASTLRRRLARLKEWFGRAQRPYPRTKAALQHLEEAVNAEVGFGVSLRKRRHRPLKPQAAQASAAEPQAAQAAAAEPQAAQAIVAKPKAAKSLAAEGESRKWYFQARRFRLERDALAAKLRSITGEKEQGSLSKEWLLRVILAQPNASVRSVEQSFADVLGSDFRTISRGSLNAVRDAWVEFYKPMVLEAGGRLVDACLRRAVEFKAGFAPVYLVHVQDEADIRLRSESARDGPVVPSRSRSSKVQQHVLTMHGAGGQVLDLPMELEALGDKSAPTLATSFERMLRWVSAGVFPQPQAGKPEVWVFHILLGDGIGTNEKAAKILWACIQQQQLSPGTRYFLLVLKCVTHQTGLSAKSSVIGRSAAIGAGGGELYKTITGVASRLFKYVICDYYEEFVFSIREWVVQHLVVQSAEEAEDVVATGAAEALQRLYTEHVVPKEMLRLWNNGFGCMRHRLQAGEDPVEERPRVVNEFVQWITTHLLHVDSHPTLSRFFTFRGCLDRMFTMHLIGMPQRAFRVRSMKPRQENQKRLRAVDSFFKHEEASQTLRRTCLAFQLTGGVEAMASANPSTGDTPVVVRFARGDAGICLEQRCQDMFVAMATCDPSLDIAPAISVLLSTAMDMHIRIAAFIDYPIALCRMSKKFFPYGCMSSIHAFLRTPVAKLDVGVGVQLQAMAWKNGDELAACSWILSKQVQDLLDGLCMVTMANSLPAERRHSEIKKWEASKLTHIAAASRNAIAMRFLRWRGEQCLKVDAKQKELRRNARTNATALAWKQADNRPSGVRFAKAGAAAATGASVDISAGKAMSAYVAEHRFTLEAERKDMVMRANEELTRLVASFPVLVTRSQWEDWISENIGAFREKMRTAPTLRRQGNVRLTARPGLPAALPRIQPLMENELYKSEWLKRLANREGWWGVRTRNSGNIIVFLTLLRGRTYYLELSNRAATGAPSCILDSSFLLQTCLHELAHLEVVLADDEVLQVWEFKALAANCDILPCERCLIYIVRSIYHFFKANDIAWSLTMWSSKRAQ